MIYATDYNAGIKNACFEFNDIPVNSRCDERKKGFCPFGGRPTVVCKCGLSGMIENGCLQLLDKGEKIKEVEND